MPRRAIKNAPVPQQIVAGTEADTSAVPPGLTGNSRPLSAYYHTPALITEIPSGSPNNAATFGPPSKAHSPRPSLPHFNQQRLSARYTPALLTLSHWFVWVQCSTETASCQVKNLNDLWRRREHPRRKIRLYSQGTRAPGLGEQNLKKILKFSDCIWAKSVVQSGQDVIVTGIVTLL